jgi:nitroimidazol reductase NimA-like FMN-containing flavoprotein (pyridoxamine 5'-phosphate oxidase superfamily)
MTIERLEEYGITEMTDDEVETFLSSNSLGVLGLPAEDTPYLLPMSYGYAGGNRLYFFYVIGESSGKRARSERADVASFLVYSAETMFNWRSVLLTGTIEHLPESQRTELSAAQTPDWRPELFETASGNETTQFYEFRVDKWTGIRHTGLPPGFHQDARAEESP